MGVLADWQIRQLTGMVVPMEEGVKRPGKISWGISSYGIDVRLGYRFKVFNNAFCGEVDPKNFDPKSFVEVDLTAGSHEWTDDGFCKWCGYTVFPGPDQVSDSNHCKSRGPKDNFVRIPPNSFVLGESLETFDIPRDVLAICLGKSTYARCGLIVNVTPLEPEWKGKVTIEISNTTPLPARVYAGEGICQILFIKGDQVCRVSYADKGGRYQHQKGIVLPFVEGRSGDQS